LDGPVLHSELELFRRISEGDTDAFTILFRQYFEPLKWNAAKLLKSDFWAEEVVQDVFTQLWSGRERLAEVQSPDAYLFRITANRCFDRIRRQALEVKIQYLITHVIRPEATSNQQNSYDLNVIEKLIREAVDQLPAQQKLVFELQRNKELSYQEIADQLRISRNTVRNHMVKALQAIRTHLASKGEFFLLLFSVWYHF